MDTQRHWGRSQQKPHEVTVRKKPFYTKRCSGETKPAKILTWGFSICVCEKTNCCCSRHLVCGTVAFCSGSPNKLVTTAATQNENRGQQDRVAGGRACCQGCSPRPKWWKEGTESHRLFSSICRWVTVRMYPNVQKINKCN